MKKLILAILIVFAAGTTLFAAGDVKWMSLKEGSEKARTEKKPMVVDFFFGEGCPRCVKLVQNVYKHPTIVSRLNNDFVPVMVDLSKKLTAEEEALGNAHDYKNDCLLLFLDPDGNVVKDPMGKKLCFVEDLDPEIFGKYLDMVRDSVKGK